MKTASMKYFVRNNIYKSKNVSFKPDALNAYSYDWWRFVAKVEGKLIFNDYRYSVSTARHQQKVSNLLSELNIKIDISMPLPRGIRHGETLAEMVLESEEYLCDIIGEEIIKKQERYQRAKRSKLVLKIIKYLENDCHFRDYEILDKRAFGKINKIAVHQCVDAESLEHDVNDAISSFSRDGFPCIVFYA